MELEFSSQTNDSTKNINSQGYLKHIKSIKVLKKIFNNIIQYKYLLLIKHNKELQKKLDINIDDYRILSQIEIEMTLSEYQKDKFFKLYTTEDKYINIINKKDEQYYHIYINNRKEELKTKEHMMNNYIKKVKIIIDYQVQSLEKLFFHCQFIESINFIRFYRNNIINMNSMFRGCSSLKKINMSNFNTKNVLYMNNMFAFCEVLEEIDLAKFDTKNVIEMNSMFNTCSAIKELNLKNFSTKNVTSMAHMFGWCLNLKN